MITSHQATALQMLLQPKAQSCDLTVLSRQCCLIESTLLQAGFSIGQAQCPNEDRYTQTFGTRSE